MAHFTNNVRLSELCELARLLILTFLISMYINLSGFDKTYLQKFQLRFNNLTLEVN